MFLRRCNFVAGQNLPECSRDRARHCRRRSSLRERCGFWERKSPTSIFFILEARGGEEGRAAEETERTASRRADLTCISSLFYIRSEEVSSVVPSENEIERSLPGTGGLDGRDAPKCLSQSSFVFVTTDTAWPCLLSLPLLRVRRTALHFS